MPRCDDAGLRGIVNLIAQTVRANQESSIRSPQSRPEFRFCPRDRRFAKASVLGAFSRLRIVIDPLLLGASFAANTTDPGDLNECGGKCIARNWFGAPGYRHPTHASAPGTRPLRKGRQTENPLTAGLASAMSRPCIGCTVRTRSIGSDSRSPVQEIPKTSKSAGSGQP